MSVAESTTSAGTLEREVRRRRLWYHDIEIADGLRTRFPEDYEVNPVLRRVDEAGVKIQTRLAANLPANLAGMSVLDLGCADGLHAVWMARRGARRVLGVERNRYNFEHADFVRRVLELDNLEFRWGSVERSFPDETFDVVFCFGLIYHLINPLGTLSDLRAQCRDKLFLTSAVDLEDGDGSPLCRLDRYATGAHGLWSFNTPMVRQLLTTAGFDILEESIEPTPGGHGYAAVAAPGRFSAHHIFAETLDQEFPINVYKRRQRVRETWRELGETTRKPVALFGAGTHTPWLMEQIADLDGPKVSCVLDDRIPLGTKVAGLKVCRPTEVEVEAIGAVVLSSWHQSSVLRQRAVEVFGTRLPVVSFDQS